MGKIKLYFVESYNELVHKVTWPTWRQLMSTASLVLVASIVIAAIIFGIDSLLSIILRYTFYR